MKIKQTSNNGNLETDRYGIISTVLINPESRDWTTLNNLNSLITNYDNITDSTRRIANINLINYNRLLEHSANLNNSSAKEENTKFSELVYNQQYRLNSANNRLNFLNSPSRKESVNLEVATETFLNSSESLLENSNESPRISPDNEEKAFDTSDTDEIQASLNKPVPRGIVNPNYPGFQHLAHTLQDYSSNIENFYQSENDMTDDDIDVDITDATYDESKDHEMSIIEDPVHLNNNNNNNKTEDTIIRDNITLGEVGKEKKNELQTDIPDLLKTVPKNNSVDSLCCDIDNNFEAKNIIGNFNKEVEDEIKQVLNYNLNIIDNDLEKLRNDIKENLSKPIENTINNISTVVNEVIKKLVQDSDTLENRLLRREPEYFDYDAFTSQMIREENQRNTLKDMSRNRPTFLYIEDNINNKITDAFLSDGKDELNVCEKDYECDKLTDNVEKTIRQLSTELRKIIPKLDELRERDKLFSVNKFERPNIVTDGNCNQIRNTAKHFGENTNGVSSCIEKPVNDSKETYSDTRKKITDLRSKNIPRLSRDRPSASGNSRSLTATSVRKLETKDDSDFGSFDVYNIETALPKLDLDAIESHLKAAKEAERRKRTDREEIRKRLAMGVDNEEYYSLGHIDRPGRKPSLQSRLQNGMNLQICFMNETASDNESQASDVEKSANSSNKSLSKSSIFSKSNYSLNNHPYQTRPLSVAITKNDKISTVQSGAKLRPSTLSVKAKKSQSTHSLGHIDVKASDFFALQATLQTEARIALAQAKEMARIQMERERRTRAASPVTEMLRHSMEKAQAPLAADRRRLSRHILTLINIPQLQVIVNELHSQIESLNEGLVQLLMARDELHMSQDSMLVDIEDLTRYLGVKEQTKKTKGGTKSAVRRLTSLVGK